MPSELEQAVEIVGQLQDWIDNFEGLSVVPIANVCWSPSSMQICVGDHVVYWCQEDDELTLENCKAAWLEHVNSLLPFAG